ncbi:MAG: transposase [Myxococcales bacterium]|nr:transposase [Deltaproteobacteria bacterium]NNL25650.1 transposase [Myxococcales bacterium]
MPRIAGRLQPGYCYHVLNRGNGKAPLFLDRVDYRAFVELLAGMKARYEIGLLAFCLMPNHFHLVLRAGATGAVSAAMQWVQTSYVSRFRVKYESSGHIFQGRFKSFPIQSDEHLVSVMRYVERNPVRAKLVERATSWPWSSARWRSGADHWLDESPVDLGSDWAAYVNAPQTSAEIASLRSSVTRGVPFGSRQWQHDTANILGLASTLQPRGRPKKK